MPSHTFYMPCSRCGAEKPTVRLYLSHAASRKVASGFYSDLLVYLCEPCLRTALEYLPRG